MTDTPEDAVPPWGSPEPGRQQPVLGNPDEDEFACPHCGHFRFREEEGRLNTKWGMGGHILTMRICQRCQYVMFFYQTSGAPG